MVCQTWKNNYKARDKRLLPNHCVRSVFDYVHTQCRLFRYKHYFLDVLFPPAIYSFLYQVYVCVCVKCKTKLLAGRPKSTTIKASKIHNGWPCAYSRSRFPILEFLCYGNNDGKMF